MEVDYAAEEQQLRTCISEMQSCLVCLQARLISVMDASLQQLPATRGSLLRHVRTGWHADQQFQALEKHPLPSTKTTQPQEQEQSAQSTQSLSQQAQQAQSQPQQAQSRPQQAQAQQSQIQLSPSHELSLQQASLQIEAKTHNEQAANVWQDEFKPQAHQLDQSSLSSLLSSDHNSAALANRKNQSSSSATPSATTSSATSSDLSASEIPADPASRKDSTWVSSMSSPSATSFSLATSAAKETTPASTVSLSVSDQTSTAVGSLMQVTPSSQEPSVSTTSSVTAMPSPIAASLTTSSTALDTAASISTTSTSTSSATSTTMLSQMTSKPVSNEKTSSELTIFDEASKVSVAVPPKTAVTEQSSILPKTNSSVPSISETPAQTSAKTSTSTPDPNTIATAPSSTSKPVTKGAQSSEDDISMLSVKQLKTILQERGVQTGDLVEKSDYVAAVHASQKHSTLNQKPGTQASNSSDNSSKNIPGSALNNTKVVAPSAALVIATGTSWGWSQATIQSTIDVLERETLLQLDDLRGLEDSDWEELGLDSIVRGAFKQALAGDQNVSVKLARNQSADGNQTRTSQSNGNSEGKRPITNSLFEEDEPRDPFSHASHKSKASTTTKNGLFDDDDNDDDFLTKPLKATSSTPSTTSSSWTTSTSAITSTPPIVKSFITSNPIEITKTIQSIPPSKPSSTVQSKPSSTPAVTRAATVPSASSSTPAVIATKNTSNLTSEKPLADVKIHTKPLASQTLSGGPPATARLSSGAPKPSASKVSNPFDDEESKPTNKPSNPFASEPANPFSGNAKARAPNPFDDEDEPTSSSAKLASRNPFSDDEDVQQEPQSRRSVLKPNQSNPFADGLD